MANEVLPENYSIFARIVKTAATHLGKARNKYLLRRPALSTPCKPGPRQPRHPYPRTPVSTYSPAPRPPRHRFIALSPARGSCAAPAAQAPRCTPASIAPQRRSPALNPLPPPPPTPQRSGGVSRGKGESKEGPRRSRAARLECGCRAAARNTGRVCAQCGAGNRNPPGPPWPPEAATR